MSVSLVISDLGLGNLRSVERAFVRAAADAGVDVRVTVSDDPDAIRHADKIVVPGQGGFGACSRALENGRGDALRESIARGTPYFGICLGLQILFDRSDEARGARGLSVFAGDVTRIVATGTSSSLSALGNATTSPAPPLKIPHTGWNVVTANATNASALVPATPTHFYFVHSFVARPTDRSVIAATTSYGEELVTAVAKDNVFACQFHPEKSQKDGLALIARFLRA